MGVASTVRSHVKLPIATFPDKLVITWRGHPSGSSQLNLHLTILVGTRRMSLTRPRLATP